MPTEPTPEKQPVATPPQKPSDSKAKELLREQTKTEAEQRPYLDTEGGE
jgi:hypothetical protein